MRKKVGCGVLACLMVIYMYTFVQFHKMNAFIEKIDSVEFGTRFYSYNTLMLYIDEKNEIMYARDWVDTTIQKQVTRFLREFYGEKWVRAYKTGIKFYRRFNIKKYFLRLWFYIVHDKNGTFHFTFTNVKDNSRIEFNQN